MYAPIEYENELMNWFSKHLIEVFIAVIFAFMAWEARLLIDLSREVAVMKTDVAHINRAVNNVGAEEQTLRQMVVEIGSNVKVQAARIGALTDTVNRNHP